MANGTFGGGNGSMATPYLVEDAKDINAIRNGLTLHYKQTAPIDMIEYANFVPIGGTFGGIYDGQRHPITNLKISTGIIAIGLFSTSTGTLRNINLLGVDVVNTAVSTNTTNRGTGSLVGVVSSGAIENCSSTGSVTCSQSYYTGGLVGMTDTTSSIKNSYSKCSVIGLNYVGGFVGNVKSGTIENCYSTGGVEGSSVVGGFSGCLPSGSGKVTNSYSSGIPKGVDNVGGFVGIISVSTSTNNYALCSSVIRSSGTVTSFGKFFGLDTWGQSPSWFYTRDDMQWLT